MFTIYILLQVNLNWEKMQKEKSNMTCEEIFPIEPIIKN